MREIRTSGSMSGRWKRSTACGSEPRRGNPDTRTYRCLPHRATSRLYSSPREVRWGERDADRRRATHLCAVERRWFSVGEIPTRQGVAPAGSNRSGSGGNEAAEAFDGKGRLGRLREQAGRNVSERRAGPEMRNVGADPASEWGRPPSRVSGGATPTLTRGPTGVMATACLHKEARRNTGSPEWWVRDPTGCPRGIGQTTRGVGEAHSTGEAGQRWWREGASVQGRRPKWRRAGRLA